MIKRSFGFTIGTKLIGLIALLLIGSITAIVYQSTQMYIGNDKENIRVSNVETTGSLATQVRETFSSLTDKIRFFGTLLLQDQTGSVALNNPVARESLDQDKDFLGVAIFRKGTDGTSVEVAHIFSQEFISLDGDGSKTYQLLTREPSFSTTQLYKGEPQISPLKLIDGSSAVAVGIPLIQSESSHGTFTHIATAFIRPAKFAKAFSENSRGSSYLVDRQGRLLAHTDANRVGENVSNLPVVKELLSGKKTQNLVPYVDPLSGEAKLASYRVIGFAGLGVVAELPEGLAYQAANTMGKRSVWVGLIILFLAFWAGYMYSGSLTRPIIRLVDAAQKIANGDFKINLLVKGRDEIAHLSNAFNQMAKGLEERDRVKATFNKFHNKEIAEKLLSGEVNLGGERKEATIFFSDVRGFTAMSETMEPEQVVEMLNEYMTRMVAIIRANHGIVDKYVGDAIMALWGVPLGKDDDVYLAVKTCLLMREELARLNELRISRGQTPLKIGMGLNVGQVIAGNIGSVEKMEYTVIGDSVNLASRMESMTKEYGTDFLIPKSIYDRVQSRFIFERCQSAKVKGKSALIEVYKVNGYYDAQGKAVLISTPYSTYQSERSDKMVHDQEENTGQIERITIEKVDEYYVEMCGEVLGPFSEEEFEMGMRQQEFPDGALYGTSKLGPFSPISSYGNDDPVIEFDTSKLVLAAPPVFNSPAPELIPIVAESAQSSTSPVAPVAAVASVTPPPFNPSVPPEFKVSPPPFKDPAKTTPPPFVEAPTQEAVVSAAEAEAEFVMPILEDKPAA